MLVWPAVLHWILACSRLALACCPPEPPPHSPSSTGLGEKMGKLLGQHKDFPVTVKGKTDMAGGKISSMYCQLIIELMVRNKGKIKPTSLALPPGLTFTPPLPTPPPRGVRAPGNGGLRSVRAAPPCSPPRRGLPPAAAPSGDLPGLPSLGRGAAGAPSTSSRSPLGARRAAPRVFSLSPRRRAALGPAVGPLQPAGTGPASPPLTETVEPRNSCIRYNFSLIMG